jgi:hypothetical protein
MKTRVFTIVELLIVIHLIEIISKRFGVVG